MIFCRRFVLIFGKYNIVLLFTVVVCARGEMIKCKRNGDCKKLSSAHLHHH